MWVGAYCLYIDITGDVTPTKIRSCLVYKNGLFYFFIRYTWAKYYRFTVQIKTGQRFKNQWFQIQIP